MRHILDLQRYPLDRLESEEAKSLIARCKADLAADGMFNLPEFLLGDAIARCAADAGPRLDRDAHTHRRNHNVYFLRSVPGLSPDHPALRPVETVHHTLCADQIEGTIASRIYHWTPLAGFLGAVMEMPKLHLMEDPLAKVNVIAYRAGEALELALRSLPVHHHPADPGARIRRRVPVSQRSQVRRRSQL